jgi:hypothetical protein
MLMKGNVGDAVWMCVDDEVIAGRLVSIGPWDDGREGVRVLVAYSDQSRCACPRGNLPEAVFPESEWKRAKQYADRFHDPADTVRLSDEEQGALMDLSIPDRFE